MSRPVEITEEDIKRWDLSIEKDPLTSSLLIIAPELKEMMRSSIWLAEQLDKLGATKDEIRDIQFSFGQKSVYVPLDKLSSYKQFWDLAQKILEDYKKGIIDAPGEKLAQELIIENEIKNIMAKNEKNIVN
jgi:hypothetical protein